MLGEMRLVDVVSAPVDRSLPNDEATLSACVKYLKLKSIYYQIRYSRNAYFASSDGLLPVSNIRGNLVSGYMSMVFSLKTFKEDVKIKTDPKLLEQKNTRHIFFFWAADVLRNLTLYLTWIESNGERCTRNYFSTMYPWPLNAYYFSRQKKLTLKFLTSCGWASEDTGEILNRFDAACKNISSALTEGPYIFNRSKPGKVDCLVAAYFQTFSAYPKYFSCLAPIISKYPSITNLATIVGA
ncbi:hypothetical protein Aperf_G00000031754 [Anoplocephala perfoliata]